MKAQITPSKYKDQPAVTIESEQVRAQFLPTSGAKLASLVYKPLGYELMVQKPGEAYRLQPFDGDYVAGECSGFDDMFPTIDTYYCDQFPWNGVKLADHGEVWSLEWEHRIEADCAFFGTNGVRFPYRLEKWASFPREDVLRIDYRLSNLSAFDFDFLWAAHIMLNYEEGTELLLPAGVKNIVFTAGVNLPGIRYGTVATWPETILPDGTRLDFRKMRPKSARSGYKYYLQGRLPEGWCGLRYPNGPSLRLSFPVEQVPYLGVLPNEGGFQDLYNIFLEPCTGTFDRPDAARYRGECSTLKGRSTYEWYLEIEVKSKQ